MPEIYRSRPRPGGVDEPVALVVHCSDPRYRPHFQEFVREGLGIGRYGLIAIPGGVQALTLSEYLPKFAWSGWRWMKFMVNLAPPERIVLMSHDDCRWYLENRFTTAATSREKQTGDLRRVRSQVLERFGAARVELYYATLQGDRASFEAL